MFLTGEVWYLRNLVNIVTKKKCLKNELRFSIKQLLSIELVTEDLMEFIQQNTKIISVPPIVILLDG